MKCPTYLRSQCMVMWALKWAWKTLFLGQSIGIVWTNTFQLKFVSQHGQQTHDFASEVPEEPSAPEPATASGHCTRGCGRGRPSRSTVAPARQPRHQPPKRGEV